MYLLILAGFRIFRRDAGSLSVSDLLVVVLIADAAQNGLAGEYKSLTEGAVVVATIFMWNFALDWLAYRSRFVYGLLNPPSLLLVRARPDSVSKSPITAHHQSGPHGAIARAGHRRSRTREEVFPRGRWQDEHHSRGRRRAGTSRQETPILSRRDHRSGALNRTESHHKIDSYCLDIFSVQYKWLLISTEAICTSHILSSTLDRHRDCARSSASSACSPV